MYLVRKEKHLSQNFISETKCLGNSQTIKQKQSINLRKKTLADAREARHIQYMYIFIKNTNLLPKLNPYRYICFNLAEDKSTNSIVLPWLASLLKIGKGRFCSQTHLGSNLSLTSIALSSWIPYISYSFIP